MHFRRFVVTAAAALALAPAVSSAQVTSMPPGREPTTPGTTPRPAPAPPQAQPPGSSGQAGEMPEAFRKQLDQLHSRNVGAVHAAGIAQQRAQSTQVKELARKISADRTTIDRQLQQVAKTHGYTPAEPSEAERQASMNVQSQMQQGGNFDLQYAEVADRDATQDEQLLKDIRGAIPGKDAAFKKWADDTENVLESHKAMARQAKDAVRSQQQRQARKPGT